MDYANNDLEQFTCRDPPLPSAMGIRNAPSRERQEGCDRDRTLIVSIARRK
ncbi:hypothetical protein [Nostoc sp. ChiQUE01b]|uniref:hypothetical protein n=1 Tax=Nostoc sp. ChiQUE01b TaxID=3075376 RepID=UPI002AD2C8E2|nr:hypothetical protein [Nostoc sp. ChiQUE01b]MDZ8261442.1 hypothetical protein [Nostoc sp. ChiQUE01b]